MVKIRISVWPTIAIFKMCYEIFRTCIKAGTPDWRMCDEILLKYVIIGVPGQRDDP